MSYIVFIYWIQIWSMFVIPGNCFWGSTCMNGITSAYSLPVHEIHFVWARHVLIKHDLSLYNLYQKQNLIWKYSPFPWVPILRSHCGLGKMALFRIVCSTSHALPLSKQTLIIKLTLNLLSPLRSVTLNLKKIIKRLLESLTDISSQVHHTI